MANEENLIPFTSEQSREEAVKNGRKGGIASGRAKREKKRAKEVAQMILDLTPELSDRAIREYAKMGMSKTKKKYTVRELSTMAQAAKAMKGDRESYKFLLEVADELEGATQNINLNTQTPIMINYDYGDDEEDTTEQVEETQEETAEPNNQGDDG